MRLTQLSLASFRSYQGVEIDLHAPRVLLTGLNGSGKTSIRESLRWLLLGYCEGTDRKGAGSDVLIPVGRDDADVSAVIAGIGRVQRRYSERTGGSFAVEGLTGTSQIQHAALLLKLATTPEYLDAILRTDTFLELNHAEAKAMVLSLLGVRIPVDGKDLTLDELDHAYKVAFEDRKAAKRVLQGHVVPPAPAGPEPPPIELIQSQLLNLRQKLGELRQHIGGTIATKQALMAEQARLSVDLAPMEVRDFSVEIEAVEQQIAALEAQPVPTAPPAVGDPSRLAFLRNRAAAVAAHDPKQGCVLDPSIPCKTPKTPFWERTQALRSEIDALAQESQPSPQETPQSRLRVLRHEVTTLQRERASQTLRLEQRKTAQARMEAIQQELAAIPSTEAQEAEIANLQARIAKGEELLRAAQTHQTLVSQHQAEATRHQALVADVDRLEKLVDTLGPKGVRVQALEKAMSTFESAVNPYVQAFGWTIRFHVEPWQVFANDRPVETYSRSERYRIGIALQLGIAQLSGLNFAVVDEVDMLDVANRGEITRMLLFAPLEQILILSTREAAQALPVIKGVTAYRLAKQDGRSVIAERSAA